MTDEAKDEPKDEPKVSDLGVVAFFAADHAVAVEGKVYVNGGFWNRLNFPSFPQVLPSMALVVVVQVPFHEYHRDHTFRMGLEDSDGKPLALKVEGSFRVGADPANEFGDPTQLPMAVALNNVVLERPGDYSFTFSIDEHPMARYPIRAMQVAVRM